MSLDPRLEAGTPSPLSDYPSYTVEQLAVLEALKDPKYELGIAKAEYVNHVLWPDGSLDADLTALQATARALRDAIEAGAAPAWASAAGDATDHTRLLKDIADHAAEKRFLFIVSTYDKPSWWLVYFQCATESNPDLPARLAAVEH